MDHTLREFIRALRNAGIRVSVSESIDAINAVKLIGYAGKEDLKNSLSASLAKTIREKEEFDACFDRFFSFDSFSDPDMTATCDRTYDSRSRLSSMLLSGDRAGLISSMIQSARQMNIAGIQFQTQKSMYVMRVLNAMGMDGVDRDIRLLLEEGTPAAQWEAAELAEARKYLIENVRDFVEKYYELFSLSATDQVIENYLRNSRLTNMEERYLHRMQQIIQRMVKRLNDLHSRKKKASRRGVLDFKKTLRKNIAYQGMLFETMWKTKKIERPDIIAICDISRSVSRIVRFLLLFLYGMNEEIARIRTFVFCSSMTEVTHLFEEYPVDQALARIQNGAGLDIMMGRTDYGRSFLDFRDKGMGSVTKKTTVLILGDARNNFYDPRTEILKTISERCKRLIWLNPESRSFWGTGDSEMPRYAPFCSLVRECNTINHLEAVVASLLRIH
ncbi:MAG: VWA domain-containing protein [Syntrophales bacterium]